MQKMCLRCRSESYEKEIDLDQYMFGVGSAAVLSGSGQSGIEGWTAAVVYGGAAGGKSYKLQVTSCKFLSVW